MALAAVAVLALLLLAAAVVWWGRELPPLDRVTDYRPRQPLQVFTQDGVEIAQFGSERRQFMAIEQMPKTMRDAVLAVEDWHFHEHPGISLRGLVRATLANVTGGMPQGASTITQQVARTFFLSTKRTPERKVKEALLALQIEQRLSKERILELYMNQIYLGQRAYGFAAAANIYFGKPLADLSLAETAMLAGLRRKTELPARAAGGPACRACGRDGAPGGGGSLRRTRLPGRLSCAHQPARRRPARGLGSAARRGDGA